MLQALATFVFAAVAVGVATLIAALLRKDWDDVCAALGIARRTVGFTPLPPHYRVNSRRATFVRMEVAPLRRAA